MTRFDLRAPKCRASASVFVYGWADQRGPACLFVSFMHTEEEFGFYCSGAKTVILLEPIC